MHRRRFLPLTAKSRLPAIVTSGPDRPGAGLALCQLMEACRLSWSMTRTDGDPPVGGAAAAANGDVKVTRAGRPSPARREPWSRDARRAVVRLHAGALEDGGCGVAVGPGPQIRATGRRAGQGAGDTDRPVQPPPPDAAAPPRPLRP